MPAWRYAGRADVSVGHRSPLPLADAPHGTGMPPSSPIDVAPDLAGGLGRTPGSLL
jgi:hypothetical protein